MGCCESLVHISSCLSLVAVPAVGIKVEVFFVIASPYGVSPGNWFCFPSFVVLELLDFLLSVGFISGRHGVVVFLPTVDGVFFCGDAVERVAFRLQPGPSDMVGLHKHVQLLQASLSSKRFINIQYIFAVSGFWIGVDEILTGFDCWRFFQLG